MVVAYVDNTLNSDLQVVSNDSLFIILQHYCVFFVCSPLQLQMVAVAIHLLALVQQLHMCLLL